MKILLVSPIPPPYGGIATWTLQYLDWAAHNSLEVKIVNTAVIGSRGDKLSAKKNYRDEINRTVKIFLSLYKNNKKMKPDIIHVNTACKTLGIIRDYLSVKLFGTQNRKVIAHYRCNIEDQISGSRVQLYFLKKLANLADLNIVLNSPSEKYLQKITGKQITILPNFIEDNKILTGSREYKNKIKKILFVGHVNAAKGIFDIIAVAKKLPEITFDIVGPIEIRIAIDEIPSNITFHGQADSKLVQNFLLESDVFLFPSFTEGFSNAMLEAMSAGLPIITTPVGANKDMIEEDGGIIVNINSPEEIENAINSMENVTIRQRMGSWNISKVTGNYTLNEIMVTLKEKYRKISKGGI